MTISAILKKIGLYFFFLAILFSCSENKKYESITDLAKVIEQKEAEIALTNIILGEIYVPSISYAPNISDVDVSVELVLDSNYAYQTKLNIVYCLYNSKHRELFCKQYTNRLSRETLNALANMGNSKCAGDAGTHIENNEPSFIKEKHFLLTLDKIKLSLDLEIQRKIKK